MRMGFHHHAVTRQHHIINCCCIASSYQLSLPYSSWHLHYWQSCHLRQRIKDALTRFPCVAMLSQFLCSEQIVPLVVYESRYIIESQSYRLIYHPITVHVWRAMVSRLHLTTVCKSQQLTCCVFTIEVLSFSSITSRTNIAHSESLHEIIHTKQVYTISYYESPCYS